MTAALDLAVDAVAAHRLTRLATADVITRPLRSWVICRAYGYHRPPAPHSRSYELWERVEAMGIDPMADDWYEQLVEFDPEPPKLATLVTCRWCAGVWVAAGMAVARLVAPRAWRHVARALAVADAAALLARLEDS